jgi:hypothetical protein
LFAGDEFSTMALPMAMDILGLSLEAMRKPKA